MITIHHLDQSRSFRVIWLMEELQLPYDLVGHHRGADMRAPPALRAVHALCRSPVIVDDETVVFESSAIAEYVVHRYGQGRLSVPCHHMDYAAYLTWLHAAEGTCMPAILPMVRAMLGGPAASEAQENVNLTVLRLCDDTLGRQAHFGGEAFSIADILMHTYLALCARITPAAFERHAALKPFVERMERRDAFGRAVEVANPHEPPVEARLFS